MIRKILATVRRGAGSPETHTFWLNSTRDQESYWRFIKWHDRRKVEEKNEIYVNVETAADDVQGKHNHQTIYDFYDAIYFDTRKRVFGVPRKQQSTGIT